MPSKVASAVFRASDLMLSSGAATRPSQVMVPMYSDLTRQDMSIPFGQKSEFLLISLNEWLSVSKR
jgi:hypothetical protein